MKRMQSFDQINIYIMEENKYYVYLHIKQDTGEPFYVGKGTKNRYKSKDNRSKYWHNIVNKHGFDIIFLDLYISNENAIEREIYWIKRIGRKDLGLGPLVNFTDGGEGINGFKWTEEMRKRASISHLGKIPWNKNEKTSDETKLKQSASAIERWTDEERSLQSKKLKGKQKSEDFKNNLKGNKNASGPRSEETKKKMSESNSGKIPWNKGKKLGPLSDEHKSKISKGLDKTKIKN